MVEFVLVLVPFVLLASAQFCWLADVAERAQVRAVAIDCARYSALADVTISEASLRLGQKLRAFPGAIGQIVDGPNIAVIVRLPSHQWLPWVNRLLEIRSFARKELAG